MKLASCMLRLLPLVFASHMGMVSSQEATPMAGTYTRQGGGGDLVIQANGNFHLQTVGSNAHTCELVGRINAGQAQLAGSSCTVNFTPVGNRVEVAAPDVDACRDFCGARAWFGGNYLRPTATCTDKAIAASRKKFKRAYDAKDYQLAQATLSPVIKECNAVLSGIYKGWIRNDLALAQLRAGDAAACRQTLEPLVNDAGKSDQELRETYPPADADLFLPMIKATRTNLRLCR